jgi:hypothetical protein
MEWFVFLMRPVVLAHGMVFYVSHVTSCASPWNGLLCCSSPVSPPGFLQSVVATQAHGMGLCVSHVTSCVCGECLYVFLRAGMCLCLPCLSACVRGCAHTRVGLHARDCEQLPVQKRGRCLMASSIARKSEPISCKQGADAAA